MRETRRRFAPRGLAATLTLAIIGTIVVAGATPASAFPTKLSTNGQMDFAFGATVNSAGGAGGSVHKPESKLFYTGGGSSEAVRWWAVLGTSGPSPAAGVWLFELVDHNWVARVQLPEADPWAKADALFEDGTLYVTTRDDMATTTGNPRQSSLYKVAYAGDGAWGAVQGPFAITSGSLETLTIARDSADRLWVSYESSGRIRAAYTSPGGTSFTTVTVSQTSVKADDISAVTAFGGDRIGVFWSDQNTKRDYFAWRSDSAPVTGSWTRETALGGGVGSCPTPSSDLCADDHMNVKVYQDEVYVAVKTSHNDAASPNQNDPITVLLRRSSDGTWTSYPVATVSQGVTRPITLLSPAQDKIWVWATRGTGTDVWESSFSSPGFSSTAFVPWTRGSNAAPTDPTSTKQVVTAATGAVVETSTSAKAQYWHNEFLPPNANTPPTAQNVSTTATAGVSKTITLRGTDAQSCELTFNRPAATLASGATVSAPSAAACTGSGPFQDTATVTYTAPDGFSGSDSFTYTVNDGTNGSNTATVSITVSPPPVNSAPTAQNVSTTATAGIARTITLRGVDDETCQLTFDRPDATLPSGATVNGLANDPCTGAGPFQDTATVTYTAPAGFSGADSFTYTVHDGAAGSNTATVSIQVSAPPEDVVVFRDASSFGNPTTRSSLTVPVPAGAQPGDVLLAVINVKSTPAATTPAGWTVVSDTLHGTNFRQVVYWRIATASEPASYTWSYGESRASSGAILAYDGAATASPVETFSVATGNSTSITAPSVTPTLDGSMIVGAFGINADSTIAPPAGMTERGEAVSATRLRTEVADYVLSPAGPTGAKIATAAIAAPHIGQLVVIKPGAAPTNTAPTAEDVTTTATAGVAKTITLRASDDETCQLSFDRPDATLPSGATVGGLDNDPCTGTGPHQDTAKVTYTAPVAFSGPDSFTYSVHDGTAGSNTATVSITVSSPQNQPPSFDQDLPNRTDAEGAAISLSAKATDPDDDPLTYAATGLPGGLAINASTGLISGTISDTAAALSPYNVSVTVSEDDGATVAATDTFTWTVTADGGGGGGGSIAFRSSSTGANATATNLIIGSPAGVQAGDVMVAVLDVRQTPSTTTPAGWTQVSMTPHGTAYRQFVYTKVATASEPASYEFVFSQRSAASGAILAYNGVDTADPVDVFTAQIGTSTEITAPSATTSVDGAMVIGAFSINNSSAVTEPVGMIERGEVASGTRIKTDVAEMVQATAGATGAKTATAAIGTANIGQLVVLRPAG